MIRRAFKYGILAGTGVGSIVVLHNNHWDVSSVGLVRFGRAASTVTRIAIDYQVSLRKHDKASEEYKAIKSQVHFRSAKRLLDMCNVNGGVFIKVGQHVGALNYLVPSEYVSTLQVLHNQAPKSPLSDVMKVLKEDLKNEPSEIFSTFDEEPLGAASLAQVHKATLKDGRVVAVKVQHRKVFAHSLVDIKTMEVLVNLVAWIFPDFSFLWLAEETKRNLPLELDFIHEGQNSEKVATMFSKFTWLKIPKICWDLSTKRVLTMEFCDGGAVNDKNYMITHKIPVAKVSQRLGQLYSEMIFVHGYVHCDPHPGNILIQKCNKDGAKIVLLDHGLYSTLTDKFRLQYCRMWMSLLNADIEGMKKVGDEMGVGNLYGMLACILSARSWSAVSKGIRTVKTSQSEREHIKAFVADNLSIITEILRKVPREMLLIFKTNDLLRGIEATLGTKGAASSFLTMSQCCVKAVSDEKIKSCDSRWSCFNVRWTQQAALLKIYIYQITLWIRSFLATNWLCRRIFFLL